MTISKNLPDGWTLGRKQNGKRLLSYKGTWADRIPIDNDFEKNVKRLIECPPARLYVQLYIDGKLNLKKNKIERGLHNLVNAGLITGVKAYEICHTSTMRDWLQNNKLWVPLTKEIETEFYRDEGTYRKIGNKWYLDTTFVLGCWEELPKKAHFKSTFHARRMFNTGRATLEEIAQYSYGTLLEVAGDLLTQAENAVLEDENYWYLGRPYFTDEDLELLLYRKASSIYFQILEVFDKCMEDNRISGFRLDDDRIWREVYLYQRLPKERVENFKKLLWSTLSSEMSAHEARLRFINAGFKTIQYEHNRWFRKNGKMRSKALYQYNPMFAKPFNSDEHTLEEIRDYTQEKKIALMEMGIRTKVFKNEKGITATRNTDRTSFKFGNVTFGLYLKTGKVFLMEVKDKFDYNNKEMYTIPWGFHKWTEEKKKVYLGREYKKVHESWDDRSKQAARCYHGLKEQYEEEDRERRFLEGKEANTHIAWDAMRDATEKILRINPKYHEKHKQIFIGLCERLNSTAKEKEIGTFVQRIFNDIPQEFIELKEEVA